MDYPKQPITEGIILDDKIFRIKLFDSIVKQKNDNPVQFWFNSGIFHCLKHFSIGDINIAGKQKELMQNQNLIHSMKL